MSRLGGVERLLRDLSPVYRADEEVGAESVFWRAVLGVEIGIWGELLMGE